MPNLLIIISDAIREPWARQVAEACGEAQPTILVGTVAHAALEIEHKQLAPNYIVLDIGNRGPDVLPEIDSLAQQCKVGTRVLAVGETNDILLYRGLLARGVMDYMPLPCDPREVARVLMATTAGQQASPSIVGVAAPTRASPKRIISFFASGAGDGASMAALNTAYALSELFNGRTVLIDMDYQYGLVAKQLNLQSQYGIRELFDHPDRGIDATLIKRMAVHYDKLDVITAPTELRFLPNVSAELIRDLIEALKQNYDNVIIDLPHLWLPWIATILQHSTHVMMVSQLWLKSVSHAARMMRMMREQNVPLERVRAVINRSGAKFKEAIDARDYERVCGTAVRYTLANDIRAVTAAEAEARTVMQGDDSELANDILRMAHDLADLGQAPIKETGKSGLLSGLLKRG